MTRLGAQGWKRKEVGEEQRIGVYRGQQGILELCVRGSRMIRPLLDLKIET